MTFSDAVVPVIFLFLALALAGDIGYAIGTGAL